MMPFPPQSLSRRLFLLSPLVLAIGCHSPIRKVEQKDLAALTDADDGVHLIGEMCTAVGMNYVKVESVGVVTGLRGTGSAPTPGHMESQLMTEMKTRQVEKPRSFLKDPDTAMVMVTGFLPPGIRKHERFDLFVSTPRRSKTTSLRGGWLMGSRMREHKIVNNSVHSGHVTALGEGPLMVETAFRTEEDTVYEKRGRIMGGGVAQANRPLGLVIHSDHKSVVTAKAIADAINNRFSKFDAGNKIQVAKPVRDNFIELRVPSRYRNNLSRYRLVLRGIAVGERPGHRSQRMLRLEKKLLEPTTAAEAALYLEAIGETSVPSLKRGLESPDLEVRFYAAEAMAYLDASDAAEPLAQVTVDEPAFRWHTLTALAAMDHISAYDALTRLLHVDSAETRYGAFHAIRLRNPHSATVAGKRLSDFHYHLVNSNGPPMVHFRRTKRAEMVVFGQSIRLEVPTFVYAGKNMMIRREDARTYKISHFKPGEPDKVARVGVTLDDVVRGIVGVGGGYVEVLEALQNAKKQGFLPARLVVEARPRANRVYDRSRSAPTLANPIPEMFDFRDESAEREERKVVDEEMPERNWEKRRKGFFGRMIGWFGGDDDE